MSRLEFPDKFIFGSSVSAYQVEGSGGTRRGDWDEYLTRRPYEIIRPGERGPDWWTPGRAESDLRMLSKLGLSMQRLGIEWARIEPEEGVMNEEAVIRYRHILDSMKKLGMTPMITLSHFVLPSWIAAQGGWQNPKTVGYFVRFIKTVVREFPEIKYWIVMNEPSILLLLGNVIGYFPPFGRNYLQFILARHNMIKAMREGYAAIKEKIPDSHVGNAFSFSWMRPHAHDSSLELLLTRVTNYILNTNYVNATEGAMDFLGVNFYTGYYIEFHPTKFGFSVQKDASVLRASLPLSIAIRPSAYRSDWGWPIVPDFFTHLLVTMHKRYKKPIIVTENGIADREDTYRSFYTLSHLVAMWRAIQLGADIRGYLHWSGIDNLEWNEGYQKRFGLIKVDHFTGERTTRHSAGVLKDIATSGEINIEALIKKYVPEPQHQTARRITDQLLHDPRGHHVRCTYR